MSSPEQGPADYDSPQQIAEHAVYDEAGHPLDQGGKTIESTAALYSPRRLRMVSAYLGAGQRAQQEMTHFASPEAAETYRDEVLASIRKHVADNLPAYVAMALAEDDSPPQHIADPAGTGEQILNPRFTEKHPTGTGT